MAAKCSRRKSAARLYFRSGCDEFIPDFHALYLELIAPENQSTDQEKSFT